MRCELCHGDHELLQAYEIIRLLTRVERSRGNWPIANFSRDMARTAGCYEDVRPSRKSELGANGRFFRSCLGQDESIYGHDMVVSSTVRS